MLKLTKGDGCLNPWGVIARELDRDVLSREERAVGEFIAGEFMPGDARGL